MKNKKISICGTTIYPGETVNLAMPLPEHYTCAPLYMSIKVIHGTKKGPCLVVFSGVKGTELNGLEIANRLVKSLSSDEVSGTIIAIPVMNVYGLTHYPASLPSGQNLSACFPGDEKGSYGERMAHLITEEILKKADYCIEIQTGGKNHNILPQVYCNFENARARELAKVFKSPVVTNVSIENNPLRLTTESLNVPLLVYQAGEALRFDESSILTGIQGIRNVMHRIEMIAQEPENEVTPIFSKDEEWIIAHKGGILHTQVSLGQTIEKNEMIGSISDPFSGDTEEAIYSHEKGIVVGVNTAPLVHEGLQIIKIASFIDYDRAESVMEEWDKNQQEQERAGE